MRETIIQEDGSTTTIIKSPWLNIGQAAQYLNISRRDFMRVVADACPHKSFGRHRKYNASDLDKFNPSIPKEELDNEFNYEKS